MSIYFAEKSSLEIKDYIEKKGLILIPFYPGKFGTSSGGTFLST